MEPMDGKVKIYKAGEMREIPEWEWKADIKKNTTGDNPRTRFMSDEHRRVRYFLARNLPRVGAPITPPMISSALGLPLFRVKAILDDLAAHLVFIIRDDSGSVSWAFPVTVEKTPHQLTFSTGERLYGA